MEGQREETQTYFGIRALTRLQAALLRVATDLNALGARWALVGALAVAARAEPRQTSDVDFVVLVSDDREAEGIVSALLGRGYSFFEQLEQRKGERLVGMRLRTSGLGGEQVVVDLLFRFSGIEPEIVEAAEAEMLEILPGFPVPVATRGHLLALKVLAAEEREKDLLDIPLLLKVASESDLVEARNAVDLISRRGVYQGDTDLGKALAEHLRSYRERRDLL